MSFVFDEAGPNKEPDSIEVMILLEDSRLTELDTYVSRSYLIKDLDPNITFKEIINKVLFEKSKFDNLYEPSILEKIKEKFKQKECKIFCNGKEVQDNTLIKDYLIDIDSYLLDSFKRLTILLGDKK